jgi:hypothetical protein
MSEPKRDYTVHFNVFNAISITTLGGILGGAAGFGFSLLTKKQPGLSFKDRMLETTSGAVIGGFTGAVIYARQLAKERAQAKQDEKEDPVLREQIATKEDIKYLQRAVEKAQRDADAAQAMAYF